MAMSSRICGVFAILYHLLILPVNGYIIPIVHHRQSISGRVGYHPILYSSIKNDNDVSSAAVPKALGTSGDWSAYLDESKGLVFYFNPKTGESTWEPPADTDFSDMQKNIGAAKKVEMRERLKSYLEERLNDSATEFMDGMDDMQKEEENAKKDIKINNNKETTKKKAPDEDRDILSQWKQWQALIDNKRGQIYYYNKTTRESSWEKPTGFPSFKLSASKKVAMEEQRKRYLEWHKEDTDSNKVESKTGNEQSISNSNQQQQNEPTPEVTKSNALPIVQQGEWEAFFDIDSGLVFYFNESTDETTWDKPFDDFPTIVWEDNVPKVLDSGSGNISMERALGYIGMDELAEATAKDEWEAAKAKERERKRLLREGKTESSKSSVEVYETAKKNELEKINKEKQIAAQKKAKEEERLLKKQQQIELEAAEVAQKQMEEQRLEKERLEKERLEKERIKEQMNKVAAQKQKSVTQIKKQPAPPKDKPRITVDKVETMVQCLAGEDGCVAGQRKANTLYEVLKCSPKATRSELKKSYLSMAKQTHPDALLQLGVTNTAEAERKFAQISKAWKVLGDTTSRRRYDRELKAKGISSKAGNVFEAFVMNAAKAMDSALPKSEKSMFTLNPGGSSGSSSSSESGGSGWAASKPICKFFGKLVGYFVTLRLVHVYWGDRDSPKAIKN